VSDRCPECGAPVPAGGTCRDNFHALLLLEWQVPGGPGELAHFFAVASYNLQHPDGQGLTAEALAGLRAAVADVLAGRASLDEIRHRARRGAAAAGRVTRREGDATARWNVAAWPVTVADVCAEGAADYARNVEHWAASVVAAIGAAGSP
jgi:hypothetical protein